MSRTDESLLTLDIAESAIQSIPPDDRDTWIKVGMALKSEFGDSAFSLWDTWSQGSGTYKEDAARASWKSFKYGGSISIGSFIHLALLHGHVFPKEELTPEQKAERKQAAEQRKKEARHQQALQREEDKRNAREAALRAETMWNTKLLHEGVGFDKGYLAVKNIKSYGLRFSPKGSAVLPLIDNNNDIHGLQFLRPNGDKRFWPKGMKVTGHYFQIGPDPISNEHPIIESESYGTGASIHEATGYTVFVAFNAGNLMAVAKCINELFPRNLLIVAADDDYQTTGNPGVTKARKVIKKYNGLMVVPVFKNRINQDWTDFNDLHKQEGIDVVKKQFDSVIDKDIPKDSGYDVSWLAKFSLTQQGDIKADINNTRLILENDVRWKGVLGFSDFSYAVEKIKPPPFSNNNETGEWLDADTARLRCWLAEQPEYGFSPKTNDADDALLVAAQANRFHPVIEYLESLVWDKKPRIDDWLSHYLSAEKSPYMVSAGSKWLIAAIARVKEPGCKMDSVLIFEGGQGKGKSTALKILGGDFFSDTHFDIGTKDAYQQMRSVWIYEMAELDAFNKAESNRAKAFFSAQEDNYRPSYARRNIKAPRQCVIAGTTNQDHYLKDVTGNRRYWPVKCHDIDLQALRADRDQLWAEAYYRYKQKETWHVNRDELHLFEVAQEDRYQEDVWETLIVNWLHDPNQRFTNEFTSAVIMEKALEMQKAAMKPPEHTRVGLIMKRLKWGKSRPTRDGVRTYLYERPLDQQVKREIPMDEEGDLPL